MVDYKCQCGKNVELKRKICIDMIDDSKESCKRE